MPTLTAGSVITDAQLVLQDTTGTRWDDVDELLHWFNDGQREVAAIRPDACTVTAAFSCSAGTRQTLPSNATSLIDVVRNASGNAVRKAPREIMDALRPDWHLDDQAATKHFMYDPRLPHEFYVWPPAVASASLTIRYQAAPTDAAALVDVMSVDDVYKPALVSYVVWRALNKESDETQTDARASFRAHFDQFMGLKTQADAAAAPKTDPE